MEGGAGDKWAQTLEYDKQREKIQDVKERQTNTPSNTAATLAIPLTIVPPRQN